MGELLSWVHNNESTDAEVARMATAALVGAPLGSFAGGISATTAGGGHGVIGDGDLKVTQHAGTPGMSVDVAVGLGVLRGTSAAGQGCYVIGSDTVRQLTIGVADPTNARKDLVVARVNDDDYDSGGVYSMSLEVVAGTPAGSPADPSVPDNCLVLARVAVAAAASSITDGNITDVRSFAAAVGGVQRCTSATRPTSGSLYEGLLIYEVDTGLLQQYDGAAWAPLFKLTGSGAVELRGPSVVGAKDKRATQSSVTGALTVDADVAANHTINQGAGNISGITVNNLDDGESLRLTFVQDGTGGRTVAWPGTWLWPGGATAGTSAFKTTANAVNVVVIEKVDTAIHAFMAGDMKT